MRPYREAHSKSSTDNAELQMDMQEETSESTVLEAVQTELENTGNTGYTVHQAVMGDVSFRISTEDKHRFRKKQLISGLKIHPWIQRMQWDLYMTVLMRQLIYMNEKRYSSIRRGCKLETETVVVGLF